MLEGDTYAFSQGYGYGYSLKHVLNQMEKTIPLFTLTDSKSIFDLITKSKRLREVRSVKDIANIKRAYEDEISSIWWICSGGNISDNLTRENANHLLDKAFDTSYLQFTIEHWILKDQTPISANLR